VVGVAAEQVTDRFASRLAARYGGVNVHATGRSTVEISRLERVAGTSLDISFQERLARRSLAPSLSPTSVTGVSDYGSTELVDMVAQAVSGWRDMANSELPAVRIGDHHTCPKVESGIAHVGGPVATGGASVLIGGMLAARDGDSASCAGSDDEIVAVSTVLIEGKRAARLGDSTTHGGVVATGCASVRIGDPSSSRSSHAPIFGGGFVLVYPDTGEVMKNQRYQIKTAGGQIFQGVTDNAGQTVIISTESPEELQLEIIEDFAS
jgi:uncharacterized Zn-binding protein involved in type VI secretion